MKNAMHDVMVITKRQLLQLARVPELRSFLNNSACYVCFVVPLCLWWLY